MMGQDPVMLPLESFVPFSEGRLLVDYSVGYRK